MMSSSVLSMGNAVRRLSWVFCLVVFLVSCAKHSDSSAKARRIGVNKSTDGRGMIDRSTYGVPGDFSDRALLPGKAIQFKGWRGYTGDSSVKGLESALEFRFPEKFVDQCRKHNGGSLGGMLLFNTTECRGLAVGGFLGFGEPIGVVGSFEFQDDSIVGAIRSNACFSDGGSLASIVPFARVIGSIAAAEQNNPWNEEGYLAFKKSDGSIYLALPSIEKTHRVAEDYTSFVEHSAFMPLD